MKLDHEAKKVPSTWLKNNRRSEMPQQIQHQTTSLQRPSLSPIRKSGAYNPNRGLNASFTPDSRFFDVTQKPSFLNVSKPLGVTQFPLTRPNEMSMVHPSMNISRNFLNQTTHEHKGNRPVFTSRSGVANRYSNEGEIKEIVDNKIQILDSVRNRLKARRKYYIGALLVFIAVGDYFLVNILKWIIDGELLKGPRVAVPFYIPIDAKIYYIILYKLATYFLVLNLTIDTDFYQQGNKEAIKKLLTFKLYPLISLLIATWLLYLQLSLWHDIFTSSLNYTSSMLIALLCTCVFAKTTLSILFIVDGKRHADFSKRTVRDFMAYVYRRIYTTGIFAVFSIFTSLLILKLYQTTDAKRFLQNHNNNYEPSILFYIKTLIFLFVYTYIGLEVSLFAARIFLTTDFKNYFPNYKAVKTVFKLYHEVQIDSYSRDLDKHIIEGDILHYLRDNLSVIYNNCFKIGRNDDGQGIDSHKAEVNWRILNLIFALEMKQVDEIFVRASRGRNAKKFDWIDAIMNPYDYLFVNDRYTEAYLVLNSHYELLALKFEFLKELYLFSFQDNAEKANLDETQQLYKHLRSIYDNLIRFMFKFSETRTNYDKRDIFFVFERVFDSIEDILQKMSYYIEGTSFKGNLVYN